jgi:O-antigen/teichoic acid export membrane protein
MLKRVFTIGLITGAGQVFVIFALKYISQNSSPAELEAIGQIDSLVLFMMNLVALGLQSAALRNLALTNDWQEEYRQTQSARVTMGFLFTIVAILAFVNPYYLIFLAAPVFGWSGDYALYARGFPIAGSVIALIRMVIPFSCLMLGVYYQSEWLPVIYISSLIIIYILSNVTIALILKTQYFFFPVIKSLRLYIESFYLGIVILSLYFIGLGLILVLPYFYEDPVVAIAFLGLKFYVIFKGVLRIIHQTFIKEMADYQVCFKVDQLTALIGLTFLIIIVCFPNTFIRLFFGENFIQHKSYFILLAIAAFIYSAFSSLIIKAMLEKKDKSYALTCLFSALFTLLVSVLFSFFYETVVYIGVSLILGELFFTSGMLILMYRPGFLLERLLFIAKNMFFFLIPLGIKLLFGDELIPLILSLAFITVIMFASYYKKFHIREIT